MKAKFYLPAIPPPRESIPLGSIIPDIRYPQQDGYPTDPTDPNEHVELQEGRDYSIRDQDNFGTFLESAKASSFKAVLGKLLSAAHEKKETNRKSLAACKTRIYELKQPKELWRKLCSRETTRGWLQRAIGEGMSTLYFVVSYYTITDATLSSKTGVSSALSGNATVPVGEILTAGGAAAVAESVNLDIGASASSSASRADGSVVHTAGERIYALCYRKVSFNWFSPRTVDKAMLQVGNCWLMTPDNRGQDDEEDTEVVEAEIGDDDEVDEGIYETLTLGDDGVDDHEFVVLKDE